ncbi:hypothetical protein DLJ49_20245 [Rhodovulum sp. 12E13]|uniref:hypothetical protein n=1 Tax=Rhodovulum sp. 12E13 TaxID=2203891 RepID=UPI000E153EF4|nr:hypothetical protein [Rhodovulum sp. 12E13]RDC68067.1 hypothetical protein DLJ49_20245 [Rhodovulum sp. 12E13]
MRDRGALSRPGGPPPGHDLPRLLRKLAAPRAPAGGRGGALGEGDAALAALLDEIDETVMARRLLLANAAGDELALEVCNRRLLRAGPPEQGHAVPGAGGATLTYAGLEDLAALRAAFARFCGAGGVHLRERRPGGSASLEQTGVAVGTLRQAWGLPAHDAGSDAAPSPAPPAKDGMGAEGGPPAGRATPVDPGDFRTALAARAIAAAATPSGEGDAPELSGDPEQAAHLGACLGHVDALLPETESPSALVLLPGAAGVAALVLLRDDAGVAAYRVPAEMPGALAALWSFRPG